MKLHELTKEAYTHAYYHVYGEEHPGDANYPAQQRYEELCKEMQDIIDAYCSETGATVNVRRVWGSMYYDLSFDEQRIFAGDEDYLKPITLPGCDSDNAYALCEHLNEITKKLLVSAYYARYALDCISDYRGETNDDPAFDMDEFWCIESFDYAMNERNRLFARLVCDYDDGNIDSAFGEDEFESWARDKEFDANGNLIA